MAEARAKSPVQIGLNVSVKILSLNDLQQETK